MKLIIAIINSSDSNAVSSALMTEGFFATKLSTTGGFLRSGNTTFMIGTDDEKVDAAVEIIAAHSKRRTELMPANISHGMGSFASYPAEVPVGGATVFVTNIERFEKL